MTSLYRDNKDYGRDEARDMRRKNEESEKHKSTIAPEDKLQQLGRRSLELTRHKTLLN